MCRFRLGLDVTKYWLIITQLYASDYINAKAGLEVTINMQLNILQRYTSYICFPYKTDWVNLVSIVSLITNTQSDIISLLCTLRPCPSYTCHSIIQSLLFLHNISWQSISVIQYDPKTLVKWLSKFMITSVRRILMIPSILSELFVVTQGLS